MSSGSQHSIFHYLADTLFPAKATFADYKSKHLIISVKTVSLPGGEGGGGGGRSHTAPPFLKPCSRFVLEQVINKYMIHFCKLQVYQLSSIAQYVAFLEDIYVIAFINSIQKRNDR